MKHLEATRREHTAVNERLFYFSSPHRYVPASFQIARWRRRPISKRSPRGITAASSTWEAVTSTIGYRIPYRWTNMITRVEYRFDDS